MSTNVTQNKPSRQAKFLTRMAIDAGLPKTVQVVWNPRRKSWQLGYLNKSTRYKTEWLFFDFARNSTQARTFLNSRLAVHFFDLCSRSDEVC